MRAGLWPVPHDIGLLHRLHVRFVLALRRPRLVQQVQWCRPHADTQGADAETRRTYTTAHGAYTTAHTTTYTAVYTTT